MKVKIEFEVNAPTNKLLKCLYNRLDILYYDLINMDSNFKDINLTVVTHSNQIHEGTPHINFHKKLPKELVLEVSQPLKPFDLSLKPFDLYGEFCSMYHDGTCWGTRDREKCACGGLKQFCTHYPKRGENE